MARTDESRAEHLLAILEVDRLDRTEPRINRRQLRMLELSGSREEKGVGPGDILYNLIFALQILPEREGIASPFEPSLFLPVRPSIEPFFQRKTGH